MNTERISDFMLERYKYGELNRDDKKTASEALVANEELRKRLVSLDESDRELRQSFPLELLKLDAEGIVESTDERHPAGIRTRRFSGRLAGKNRFRVAGIASIAAALMLAILLPVLYHARSNYGTGTDNLIQVSDSLPDRLKGMDMTRCELSLYLKEGEQLLLKDQATLSEGNTVQLAYTAPADAEQYGVIFSIDGRSSVTRHYPYRNGQSPVLVSGKRTFLDEAYILDDAPGYEVFILVVSDKPLDVDAVLTEARMIAGLRGSGHKVNGPSMIEKESRVAFAGFEVETLTVLKK